MYNTHTHTDDYYMILYVFCVHVCETKLSWRIGETTRLKYVDYELPR